MSRIERFALWFMIGFFVSWGAISFAHAGERCFPVKKAVNEMFGGVDAATEKKLTPGQANFALGAWAVTPPFTPKMPEGAATLFVNENGNGVVFWVKGSLTCSAPAIMPKAIIDVMLKTKTGALDDKGDEI